jgi:hypothetical protein
VVKRVSSNASIAGSKQGVSSSTVSPGHGRAPAALLAGSIQPKSVAGPRTGLNRGSTMTGQMPGVSPGRRANARSARRRHGDDRWKPFPVVNALSRHHSPWLRKRV